MLGWGVVGGVTTVPIASYSQFKLYHLLLTSTTNFIQIGKIGEVGILGWLGVLGWGVVGVLEQSESLHTPNLSFTTYY